MAIQQVKDFLHKKFTIKYLGLLHYFLGLEITHLQEGVVLTQKKFTQELLAYASPLHSKPISSPLPVNLKLTSKAGALLEDTTQYRVLVGKLNFLTNTT